MAVASILGTLGRVGSKVIPVAKQLGGKVGPVAKNWALPAGVGGLGGWMLGRVTASPGQADVNVPVPTVVPEVANPPQVQNVQLPQINWERISQIFADPRATPAFYKAALGLLTDLLGYHTKMAMQREALLPRREALLPKALDVLGDMITKIDTQLASGFLPEPTRVSLALQRQELMKAYSSILGELMQAYGIPFPTQEAASTQATKPAQALPVYPYTYNPYSR